MKSTADANPVLTEIAGKHVQSLDSFAGLQLFPLFPTEKESSDYYVFDLANTVNIPRGVRRAPGTNFSRSQTKLSDDRYKCGIYGHEEPVSDEENGRYARKGAAEEAATRRATNVILINHELRSKEIATSNDVPSAVVAVKWNSGQGNPLNDVKAARQAIFDASGLTPNVMAVSNSVFEALKENPKVKELVRISSEDSRWPRLLANLFDVERFVVAKGVINVAQEGEAAIDLSEIWGTSVVLARVDFSGDLKQPSFGRTFVVTDEVNATGVTVSVYRAEKISSNIVRADQQTAEKLTGGACGFHLKQVLDA